MIALGLDQQEELPTVFIFATIICEKSREEWLSEMISKFQS